MDFERLYNMAANTVRNVERRYGQEGGSANSLPF